MTCKWHAGALGGSEWHSALSQAVRVGPPPPEWPPDCSDLICKMEMVICYLFNERD